MRRRFRASNYQSTTKVKPFICTMPMRLDEGWNQIQFNLSDFTRRAYGTNYVETLRIQIHANCRIRRIYFSDRLCECALCHYFPILFRFLPDGPSNTMMYSNIIFALPRTTILVFYVMGTPCLRYHWAWAVSDSEEVINEGCQ